MSVYTHRSTMVNDILLSFLNIQCRLKGMWRNVVVAGG